ncbi:hypothetical protein J6T21_00140 [Candidatus Saccharibacteria bacterium]|nr:hypothetical protein [Candidatus Saccharibacteria bacterium]
MAEDYGKVRSQIMALASKKVDLGFIFHKVTMNDDDPRYDAIIETLIRLSDVRKVAKMLIDGLYIRALIETIPILKRNGMPADEVLGMTNQYVLNNDGIINVLIGAGANPKLLFSKIDEEMQTRHFADLFMTEQIAV